MRRMDPAMTKRAAVLGLCLICAGCVSTRSLKNWTPTDSGVADSYHACLLQAQQPSSSAFLGGSPYGVFGSAESTMRTNKEILCSCMRTKGYTLRSPTTPEVVVDTALLPLWIPFLLIGGAADFWCPG